MDNYPIAIYLNDHLAGATGATELLQSLEEHHADLKPALTALRSDIEADRAELQTLMQRLSIDESRTRKIGGWIAEKATQFKMHIDDRSDGSLRLFESLEFLSLGIEGKLALWRALQAAADLSPELQQINYQRLMHRAVEQRSRAEALRLDAAIKALRPSAAAV